MSRAPSTPIGHDALHRTKMVVVVGIVLYNPDSDHHLCAIRAACEVGFAIVIYENSTDASVSLRNRAACEAAGLGRVHVLGGSGNAGLSAALNRIVERATVLAPAGALVLFDQDSTVTPTLLRRLLASLEAALARGPVGIIAPVAVRVDGSPYRLRFKTSTPTFPSPWHPVSFATTSGSVIPLETFEAIGKFQEDFFIDHIDLDFSERCWKAGLPVLVDTSVEMTHRIGEGDVRIAGRALIPVSAPFRHYYQCRNMILSSERAGLPWLRLTRMVFKKLASIMVTGIFAGQMSRRVRYMLLGYWDGFRGRGGSFADRKGGRRP